MTNKEKSRELAINYTKDINDKGIEVYDVMCEGALQEMAEWKDEQFAAEKQALIDNACTEFSNFLEEMKEIWWKGDGCDESVKFHWLISFRKSIEETK